MSSSLDRLFEEAREDGSLRHWEIGDTVVVHALNDLVGEVTKGHLMVTVFMTTWFTMTVMGQLSGARLLI